MAAHAISVRHPLIIEDLSNLMRLMAVNARRKDMRLFFPQFTLDDFSVDRFNLRMAFRAGGGDIPSRYGRGRICMR